MCKDGPKDKNSIAQDQGWESYDDAPPIVQNNIDSIVDGPEIEDPFAALRAAREGE